MKRSFCDICGGPSTMEVRLPIDKLLLYTVIDKTNHPITDLCDGCWKRLMDTVAQIRGESAKPAEERPMA